MWHLVRELLYPPACAACDEPLPAGGELPLCAICRQAIEPIRGGQEEPVTACFEYGGPVRELLQRYKYHDDRRALRALAVLVRTEQRFLCRLGEMGVLVPVPLHPVRLRRRGFNQSLGLLRAVGLPRHRLCPGALVRTRDTLAQTSLDRRQRLSNVAGAFASRLGEVGAGSALPAIGVVDDVSTTGATLHACRMALLDAGVEQVRLFAFARTPA